MKDLMDFKVLSRYDDLFTDLFLDNLNLWFTTTKMNDEHRRPRVPNTKILDIIQRNILENSRTMNAVDELLEMDYFKHYLSCKTYKQTQEFIQLMERYLYMYMPNAGYEISDTRRYSEKKIEACLIATRDWQQGDEMVYLTGLADIKNGILGPARFVNHDCDSNCRFVVYEENSIMLQVKRDIECGQEITVYYGDHYFGENNNQCKCVTCEKGVKKRRPTDECIPNGNEKKLKMSINFICNPHLNILDLQKTILLNTEPYSPPLSIKADSAVGLSSEREKDDLLDQFLDNISELSSEEGSTKKQNELDCIGCHLTLQTNPGGTDELATWTWSPSAVFIDWSPKRCPRCERHYSIFQQEWPHRKPKSIFSQFTTPSSALTPLSEYPYSPLSEEIEL